MWIRRRLGVVSGVICQIRILGSVQFCLLRASNLSKNRTRVVFGLKLMVGGGEHKLVLDKINFKLYYMDVVWSLKAMRMRCVTRWMLCFSDIPSN